MSVETDAINKLAEKIDALRTEVTALTTRINHPSPRDCVHAEDFIDIYKRVGVLEQWRAALIGIGTFIGILLGLFGQRVVAWLFGGHR